MTNRSETRRKKLYEKWLNANAKTRQLTERTVNQITRQPHTNSAKLTQTNSLRQQINERRKLLNPAHSTAETTTRNNQQSTPECCGQIKLPSPLIECHSSPTLLLLQSSATLPVDDNRSADWFEMVVTSQMVIRCRRSRSPLHSIKVPRSVVDDPGPSPGIAVAFSVSRLRVSNRSNLVDHRAMTSIFSQHFSSVPRSRR